MLRFLSFALAAASYARATPLTRRASGVTNSADGADGQEFDYIVVGGGACTSLFTAERAI